MILPLLVILGTTVYYGYHLLKPSPPKRREIKGPLRPQPPAGQDDVEPGPAATRLQAFLDGLTDDELVLLRSSVPESWWHYFAAAAYAPNDELFGMTLTPLIVDVNLMSEPDQKQMVRDIIASIGIGNAMTLKSILEEVAEIA